MDILLGFAIAFVIFGTVCLGPYGLDGFDDEDDDC